MKNTDIGRRFSSTISGFHRCATRFANGPGLEQTGCPPQAAASGHNGWPWPLLSRACQANARLTAAGHIGIAGKRPKPEQG